MNILVQQKTSYNTTIKMECVISSINSRSTLEREYEYLLKAHFMDGVEYKVTPYMIDWACSYTRIMTMFLAYITHCNKCNNDHWHGLYAHLLMKKYGYVGSRIPCKFI